MHIRTYTHVQYTKKRIGVLYLCKKIYTCIYIIIYIHLYIRTYTHVQYTEKRIGASSIKAIAYLHMYICTKKHHV